MTDPRLELDRNAGPAEGGDLMVARAPERLSTPVIVLIFLALGVGLFLLLNAARNNKAEAKAITTPTPGAIASAPEAPLAMPAPPAPLETTPPNPDHVVPPYVAPMAAPITPLTSPLLQPGIDPMARRRAPAVVIELGPAPAPQLPAPQVRPSVPEEAMRSPASPVVAEPPESAFAARLSGNADVAVARPMSNPGLVVPQGAVIPAVLETAINSDLPGYTRALVSRDVRSFDGKTVLIPRGSRLIGQYKSAMSMGQSRAFVIWTRVTRPDGVSVDIGSPAADELGRGGLAGEVDRHFFQRFGGSILLSVLNGIGAALTDNPSTQISIGSPVQAASAAATVQFGDAIPPTVKVRQGEAIRIFVARDLDFSLVGAMR